MSLMKTALWSFALCLLIALGIAFAMAKMTIAFCVTGALALGLVIMAPKAP